jgi:replication factor A1
MDAPKFKDQIKNLLKQVKDSKENEIMVDIYLQIYSFQESEREGKKVYLMVLCDNEYKYNFFFLACTETVENLEKGRIIHLTEVSPKPIKSSLYIRIKKYEILDDTFEIGNVKDIKEKEGVFKDPEGNNIFGEKPQNLLKTNEKEKESTDIPMAEDAYTSLKQLTTFSRDFIIFVRVTKKSEIKTFETRNNNMNSSNQGKLFYFIVLDRDGNEMQCTCFNKAVDKFYDIIEEDQLYEIKGGYVKLNDKKYTRIKSDYKIVLDENSKITKKLDNGTIKKNNMTIIRIKDIQNMNLYSIVDLCVVVLNVGEKMIKNTRNGAQPLKKIIVGDVSKYKIEISLWRVHSDTNVKFGDILLINNVKVGEYKGRNLTTFDETCIKINPPETNEYVKELEDFIAKDELKGEFLDLENNSEIKNDKIREENENYCSVHIKDVLESLDEYEDIHNLSKVTATVTQILHNEKNFYMGCSDRNCKRKLKLEENTDEYICPNCRKSTKNPTYYYTLSLRVKDASTEYWIDIFGKTAESIMKCTAEEYKDFLKNRNEEKLKELTQNIEFKVFNFWVKPKLQTYNTVSKKKLYAYRIEPYDEKNEAHKLVKYLQKEIY